MASAKGNAAKPFYTGKALYLGADDVEAGLMHAECYDISAKKMKSGRIRVDLDTCGTKAKMPHVTLDSEAEYKMVFLPKRTPRKRKRTEA